MKINRIEWIHRSKRVYVPTPSQNWQPSSETLVLWSFSSKLAFLHWRNTILNAWHYGVRSSLLIYTFSGIILMWSTGLYPIGYNIITRIEVFHHVTQALFQANNTPILHFFQWISHSSLHFFKRIKHLKYSERKKSSANHRNSKKNTTFVFNKRSVTYLRKYPITQHIVSDSGHSTKWLKESGTTRICKTMKYNNFHFSLHSVYL